MTEYQTDPERRKYATEHYIDVDELVLLDESGRRYSIFGHIIERA